MKAMINGLTLDGSDDTSPYTITEITGWDDGVDTRRESIDRPAAHGQYLMPGYLSGRLVTISGEIYTGVGHEQDHAIARLSGLLADGGTDRLVVQLDLVTQWAIVQRNGPPEITRDRWGLLARYTIVLWAVDPRKYGEQRELTAGQVALNYGTFPATPTLEVTGTSAGYTVTGPTGKQFKVTTGPGSATHRIDLARGRVYRNGVLQLGIVERADSWTIPPGPAGVTHTITAGTLRVLVTDTYV